jgi:aryl-alcohol dehydrogenase-like predicted oxidoreductase
MRRTLLGRTGLEISELAFGAGVTGGILIDADEAIRDAVLRRAVLGNPDFATRVIGISTIEQLDAAFAALAQGPLPAAAMSKLETLWSSGFGLD